MFREPNEESCKEYRQSSQELSEQILLALKDTLIAKFCLKENAFEMKFLNGQKFVVSVTEI